MKMYKVLYKYNKFCYYICKTEEKNDNLNLAHKNCTLFYRLNHIDKYNSSASLNCNNFYYEFITQKIAIGKEKTNGIDIQVFILCIPNILLSETCKE
jgi:hypothetical protein